MQRGDHGAQRAERREGEAEGAGLLLLGRDLLHRGDGGAHPLFVARAAAEARRDDAERVAGGGRGAQRARGRLVVAGEAGARVGDEHVQRRGRRVEQCGPRGVVESRGARERVRRHEPGVVRGAEGRTSGEPLDVLTIGVERRDRGEQLGGRRGAWHGSGQTVARSSSGGGIATRVHVQASVQRYRPRTAAPRGAVPARPMGCP